MSDDLTAQLFEKDQHPRIFWDNSDLDALRSKASHPKMAQTLAEVLARCETYCDADHKAFIDTTVSRTDLIGDGGNCGHLWTKIPDLIVAYTVAQNQDALTKLTAILHIIAADDSPIVAQIFKGQAGHHEEGQET